MEDQTCIKCNESMRIIDKYSRFLEPDEREQFLDHQKTTALVAKMHDILKVSTVNVEIHKCDKCGIYKGVEYV
jgi:predicted RNA-binding Zn-ribbon protein involved in translation (DUF1610 family)